MKSADYSIFKKTYSQVTSKWEGGYVNDPDDPGGETNYGITKRDYPHLDIKNLDIGRVKDIMWKDYWMKAGCDRIPYPVAPMVFDGAVNTGVRQVTKDLQQSIGATEDGILGPRTLEALDRKINTEGIVNVLIDFGATRAEFYSLLDNLDDKYALGWHRRLFDVFILCYELAKR